MIKRRMIISLFTLVLSIALTGSSQANDSKFRLGLQGAQFASGISGVMEIANPLALQGIVDVGANAVAIRVLGRFTQKQFWNAYGQGTVGLWNDEQSSPWGWQDDEKWHENNHGLGLGVGIGVEYDWRGLSASLPPIGWNIELGASVIPGFNFDFGIGVHWMF